jgi:nicotinamidase-related amidase
MSTRSLIAAEDSILIVIDVQPPFLHKLVPTDADALLQRISWLIGIARWLAIPLIVTAEDIPREGLVHVQIAQSLPPDTPVYNKMIFDLTADPAIQAAVANTRRTTAVLVGLETDVCVAHSCLLVNCRHTSSIGSYVPAPEQIGDLFSLRMRGHVPELTNWRQA